MRAILEGEKKYSRWRKQFEINRKMVLAMVQLLSVCHLLFQYPSCLIFIHALPLTYFCIYPNKIFVECQWIGQQQTFLKNITIYHIKYLQ